MAKESKLEQYIVRKYVMAKSVADALKKEKEATVKDIYVDPEWVRASVSMGFQTKK